MNLVNKIKKYVIPEIVKWVGVVFLLITSTIINYIYFCDCSFFLKKLIVLFVVNIAACIFLTTKLGKWLIGFIKESCIELKKVVWPTYHDTLNTTLVVIAVTMLISVVLWGLDSILVYIISFSLKL